MVPSPYKAHTEQEKYIKIIIPYLLSITSSKEVIGGKLLVNGLVVAEYGHAE